MIFENKKESYYNSELVNFEKLFLILKKRKKLFSISFFLIFISLIAISKINKNFIPSYLGTFTLLVSDPMDEKSDFQKNYAISNFEEIAINNTKNDIPTLILLLKSELYLSDVAKKYDLDYTNLKNRLEINVGNIQKSNVKGKFDRAEGIISVTLKTNHKEKDLNLLKDISKSFLKASIEQKKEKLQNGLDFLEEQEPIIKKKVSFVQKKIAELRIENNLIEPILDAQIIKEQLKTLDERLTVLRKRQARLLSSKEQVLKGELITKSFKEIIGELTIVGEGGLVLIDEGQNTLLEFDKVNKELSKARSKYTEDSEIIKGLENRIKKIKPFLLKKQINALENALKINENKILNNMDQIKVMQKNFIKKPQLIKKYDNLIQELKLANSNLEGISSAKESLKLQIAQNSVPWKIINKPNIITQNNDNIFIDKEIFIFFISLFTSYLIIFLKELLNNTYLSYEEFAKDFKTNLLGEMPYLNFLDNTNKNNFKEIIENFDNEKTIDSSEKLNNYLYKQVLRGISENIIHLFKDSNHKTLLITSPISNQGKSTFILLLGKTLTRLGKKILIVDLDLEKSSISKILNLSNKGFKNFIFDDNLIFNDVIQKISSDEKLEFISSGHIENEVSKLISAEDFQKFMENIHKCKNYDLVLFDSSPVLGSVDSGLIARLVEKNILFLNLYDINKNYVREVFKALYDLKENNLGIITNDKNMANQKIFNNYKNYFKYINKSD